MVNRQIELAANNRSLDNEGVTLGQRIDQRRQQIGMSQAELARRVGIRQSTMNALINGPSRSSRSIVKIARELRTTPAYLTGDTHDPDEGAPLPVPAPQFVHVMLPVALPSERALARMFEGLLRVMPPDADLVEQAVLLARRLPIGLSQLRDLLPESAAVEPETGRELAEALAIPDPAPQS